MIFWAVVFILGSFLTLARWKRAEQEVARLEAIWDRGQLRERGDEAT